MATELNKQNIYYLAFQFKGEAFVIDVEANQLANELLNDKINMDSFLYDDMDEKENPNGFQRIITHESQRYVVTFSFSSPKNFDVFNYVEETDKWGTKKVYGEGFVEKNIPWVCIEIRNNGETIYRLEP